MFATRGHRLVAFLLAVLLAVAGAVVSATPASADDDPVSPNQYIVGGCRISLEWGWPKPVGSADKPCVGVEDVSRNGRGDIEVHLTEEESEAAIRLMAQSGTRMAEDGIVAGATGGRDVVTLRLYDDRERHRVNLNTSSGRASVIGTTVWVGWTKEAGRAGGTDAWEIRSGYNALGSYRDRASTSWNTVPGGCVVRFSSAGPQVHANGSHRCVGVRSVSITSTGRLEVVASDEQRGSVINAQADPDETLTGRGLATGVSVSSSRMFITFYDSRLNRPLDLTNPHHLRRVSGRWANLWLSWTKNTRRPGSPDATMVRARNKYGPYRDGSVRRGDITQSGCSVRFAQVTAEPTLNGNSVRLCTGPRAVVINQDGEVVVLGNAGGDIVSSTMISSRSLTDYGVRTGLSGGAGTNRYVMYSMHLNRTLDLRNESDRQILRRTGSQMLIGWGHWTG